MNPIVACFLLAGIFDIASTLNYQNHFYMSYIIDCVIATIFLIVGMAAMWREVA